jgi:large subunit ribosomal protein L28
MAKVCESCGKRTITGNKISHAHNLTKRRWYPNLRKVKVKTPKGKKTLLLCTRCIRSGVHLK